MTSRELVLNAARRKPSNGSLPITIGFADNATAEKYAAYMGLDWKDFGILTDSDVKGLLLLEDVQFRFGGPLNKIAYEYGFAKDSGIPNAIYDIWGCAWSIEALGQELRESPIKNMEDVYNYPYPDPDNPNIFWGIAEQLETFHNAGYATMINQFYSLFERAWALTGYTEFLVACHTDPDAVEYLLDVILNYKMHVAEKICSLGVTLGHTGDDFGLQNSGVMSPELFRKLFKPRYEKLWGVYKKHGIPVVHHSCGDCSIYLEDMIDAGLDVLDPVQQTAMDIRMLSERFGKDLSFMGSIDTIETLTYGTPDDVKRNIDETVRYLGKYNGLILSMGNIMPNTPGENVKTALEQLKQYRNKS